MPQSRNVRSGYIYVRDIGIHPRFKLDPDLGRNVLFYPSVLLGVASVFCMTIILISV